MKKSKNVTRFISILLTLALGVSILSVDAFALYGERLGGTASPTLCNSSGSPEDILSDSVDVEALREYLFQHFYGCEARVDITSFKIPYSQDNASAICNFIFYEMPEAFQVSRMSYYYNSSYITALVPSYTCTADEYATMYSEFSAGANKLLQGIKDNSYLSQEEKALLLHDRLAVWNEYDYDRLYDGTMPDCSYDAYGVFAKRTSVCKGYALAYTYLLDQVGIKSDYCSSSSLNHAWNIVYINSVPYHVDVTWDDPVRDITGLVKHENFLISSDKLYETGHTATDYSTAPQDTRYDDYYWQNSTAQIQWIDGIIYYIDNSAAQLKKRVNGTVTSLISVSDTWRYTATSYWPGCYARLSGDGGCLFVSLTDGVYEYDFDNNSLTKVFTPDFTGLDYFSIFGFTYEDGYFICDLHNSPNFTATTKTDYQVKQLYHIFNREVPSPEYLKSAATCTSPAVYYKSCECGAVGKSTFEYGNKLQHNYTDNVCDNCGYWEHQDDTPKFRLKNTSAGVEISWDSLPGATGYIVYYKNGTSWVRLGTVTSGLSYVDTAVASGNSKTYTLKAYNTNLDIVTYSKYNTKGKTITYNMFNTSDGTYIDENAGYIYTENTGSSNIADVVSVYSGYTADAVPSSTYGGKSYYGTGSKITVYNGSGQAIGTYTLVVFGDVNGDSVIDVLDVSYMEMASNFHYNIDGCYSEAADFDENGTVDAADYAQAVNLCLLRSR